MWHPCTLQSAESLSLGFDSSSGKFREASFRSRLDHRRLGRIRTWIPGNSEGGRPVVSQGLTAVARRLLMR